jgi:hypothetical protein
MSSDGSGAGVPLLEPLLRSPSPSPSIANSGKRKREDKAAGKKAKKQKRTKKPKDINEDDLDATLGINLGIGRMDGQLLVDYVAQRTKRTKPKLSTVELEDLYLPGIVYVPQPGEIFTKSTQRVQFQTRLHGNLPEFWNASQNFSRSLRLMSNLNRAQRMRGDLTHWSYRLLVLELLT